MKKCNARKLSPVLLVMSLGLFYPFEFPAAYSTGLTMRYSSLVSTLVQVLSALRDIERRRRILWRGFCKSSRLEGPSSGVFFTLFYHRYITAAHRCVSCRVGNAIRAAVHSRGSAFTCARTRDRTCARNNAALRELFSCFHTNCLWFLFKIHRYRRLPKQWSEAIFKHLFSCTVRNL